MTELFIFAFALNFMGAVLPLKELLTRNTDSLNVKGLAVWLATQSLITFLIIGYALITLPKL